MRNFGFVDSLSVIFMSKINHNLESQYQNVMEVVDLDRHVSTVSINQEKNFAHNTSHLNKAEYKKKIDLWMPHEFMKKPHAPHFDLWISAESQKTRIIAEVDGYWW